MVVVVVDCPQFAFALLNVEAVLASLELDLDVAFGIRKLIPSVRDVLSVWLKINAGEHSSVLMMH